MNENQREKLKGWGINAFLDKPYRETDVLSLVRKVLAQGPQPVPEKKKSTLPRA
jgi:hypothetical protein